MLLTGAPREFSGGAGDVLLNPLVGRHIRPFSSLPAGMGTPCAIRDNRLLQRMSRQTRLSILPQHRRKTTGGSHVSLFVAIAVCASLAHIKVPTPAPWVRGNGVSKTALDCVLAARGKFAGLDRRHAGCVELEHHIRWIGQQRRLVQWRRRGISATAEQYRHQPAKRRDRQLAEPK